MEWIVEILITAVNAGIMIFLAFKQAKLQQQQTELQRQQTEFQRRQTAAQEYEIYKSLYRLLVQVHDEVNNFMHNISFGTWGTYYQTDKDSLKQKEKHINQLKEDLMNNYVDYELKFSEELFNREAYRNILSKMSAILTYVNREIEEGKVLMPMGSQRIPNVDGDMEKGAAVAIAKRFEDANMMFNGLMSFIELKRALGNCDDVLETIKKKCKIY